MNTHLVETSISGAIDPLHVLDGIEGRGHGRDLREKAAHVAVVGDAHRQEGAVGIERELGGEPVIAAVAVGDEAARALVGPLDRTAERGVQHADIFRKRRRLHAERAADMTGQDANLLRLDLKDSALARSPNTPCEGAYNVKRPLAGS